MSSNQALYTSTGMRIAAFRKEEQLSQQKFANELGVSRGYIGDIERGRSEPSSNFLTLITSKFGISIDWVLTGEGEPYRLSSATKWGRISYDGTRYCWSHDEKKMFSERIQLIQHDNKLNYEEFLKKIDVTKRNMVEAISSNVPCIQLLGKIERAFPNISIDWLVTGEGSMLKGDDGLNKIISMYTIVNESEKLDMLRAVKQIYEFKQVQDELKTIKQRI